METEGVSSSVRIDILLRYTSFTDSDSNIATNLRRIPNVRSGLNQLVNQVTRGISTSLQHNSQSQFVGPNQAPRRSAKTFEIYEPSDLESAASVASMSSEKAVTAKDKLEGTYKGSSALLLRLISATIYKTKMLTYCSAQIKSADMVSK